MATELKLKKFNMSKMKCDSIVLLLAKRRTGKSFLCRDIMYNHKDIPTGIVVSPTEKANTYYGDFVPDVFIHDEYSPELLDRFLKRQRTVREVAKANPHKKYDERAFIVMDDCMFDNKWVKDSQIREIFFNGRHYSIFFILLMQYAMGITPALRTNIDYVFILKETTIANRKKLYDHYAGVFPSFDTFCQAMDQCTNDYECLVIDNTIQSNNFEDQVYWFKATPRDTFHMGSQRYWQYSRQHYDPEHESRSGYMDMNDTKSGKKKKYVIKQVRK
jgi:hypothetical protein